MISKEIRTLIRDHNIDLYLKDGQLAVRWLNGQVDVEVAAVLKAHKAELIQWLAATAPEPESEAEVPLRALGLTEAVASDSQRSLWTLDELNTHGQHYALPILAELTGPLDHSKLEAALGVLVERHPSLRTRFRLEGNELLQQVRPATGFTLPLLDLSSTADLETALAVTEAEIFDAPFDLARGPLFRGCLVTLSERRHRLYLAGHHIIIDGWSVSILLQDLALLYPALTGGAPIDLPPLPIQFTDYSHWQQAREATPLYRRQLDFWRHHLENAPLVHNLPLDRPRGNRASFAGGQWSQSLSPDCGQALRHLASAQGTTLFTLVYAALVLLLSRHSNSNDLVVGTPVANRRHPDLNHLVGYVANVIPIRTRVEPGQTFTDFLRHCHHQVFTAFEHQEVAFDRIVEVVNPPRNLSHNPLFQIMMTVETEPGDSLDLGDLKLQLEQPGGISAKHDLTLAVQAHGDDLTLHWTYATDLFDRATVERLSEHFAVLLDAIATSPDTEQALLPMMSGEERRQVLDLSQGPSRAYDANHGCHRRFEHWAATDPDLIAIQEGEQCLTYGALNQAANHLAGEIQRRLAEPGHCIGILAARGIAFVLAQLAILKSGNIFVALDPAAPAARKSAIIEDTGLKLVLAQHENPGLADVEIWPIPLDTPEHEVSNPTRAINPDEPAYVVFTSGSTGRPKGAVNTQRGLLNMALNQQWLFDMGPETVMTVSANVAFDSVLWEIWPTLISGGRLVINPDAILAEPLLLERHLNQVRPTHFWLPTGLMETLNSLAFEWPASISHVFTGGDRLTAYCLPERMNARLINIYGPSECSVWATCHPVRPGDSPPPVGKPLANVSTYVLDEHANLLPLGAVGEICIGGDNVGLGYINNAELTARCFQTDPFTESGALYRTGDLGRWRADGTLECLGRRDGQVKVRGFRVELAEISAHLLSNPKVSQATCHLTGQGGGKAIVAFVVPREAEPWEQLATQLGHHLSHLLPSYMVPSAIHLLDELPLTANGKIDRRRLDEWVSARPQTAQVNTSSPRDQLELTLYGIWRSILVRGDIGIRDSFFDVGGTSIAAIKVMAAVNQALGTRLAVSELLNHPTIEALAGLIRMGAKAKVRPGSLIDLKAGDGGCNIVCVHPAGGTAFCYLSLAKGLPAGLGVFGLQAKGVYPGDAFLPDLTAMARHHLDAIRHLLDRPLVLVGASFGGLLGFEMIRLLHEAGVHAASVIMLDTEGTDDPEILARMQPVTAEVFREKLVRYNGMYPGIEDAQIEQYHQLYNHHLKVQRDYRAQHNPGRVVLVQATDDTTAGEREFAQDYWRHYTTGELTVIPSPGTHASMLESPAVDNVARIVLGEVNRIAASAAQKENVQ